MEKEKKQLLKQFLIVYLAVEIILLLQAVINFYLDINAPIETMKFHERSRTLFFLIPGVFGVLAPIFFFIMWKWIYWKK